MLVFTHLTTYKNPQLKFFVFSFFFGEKEKYWYFLIVLSFGAMHFVVILKKNLWYYKWKSVWHVWKQVDVKRLMDVLLKKNSEIWKLFVMVWRWVLSGCSKLVVLLVYSLLRDIIHWVDFLLFSNSRQLSWLLVAFWYTKLLLKTGLLILILFFYFGTWLTREARTLLQNCLSDQWIHSPYGIWYVKL